VVLVLTIAEDVVARFSVLGKSLLLITGTDGHGQVSARHRVMGDRPKPTVMIQLGLHFGNS